MPITRSPEGRCQRRRLPSPACGRLSTSSFRVEPGDVLNACSCRSPGTSVGAAMPPADAKLGGAATMGYNVVTEIDVSRPRCRSCWQTTSIEVCRLRQHDVPDVDTAEPLPQLRRVETPADAARRPDRRTTGAH